jgi:hypothetical protein
VIAVILATGPSMSQAVADSVRGRATVIAVSDAHRLAPWSDALVSTDARWWKAHPEALEFAGRKLGGMPDFAEIRGVERVHGVPSSTNSGLLACQVAVSMGANTLLLTGFDLGGTHFFGEHKPPLKNTTPMRFETFIRQFERYKPKGVKILNCTPGSALKCYPFGTLSDCLAEPAVSV